MTGSHSRLGISDRESRTTGVIRAYDTGSAILNAAPLYVPCKNSHSRSKFWQIALKRISNWSAFVHLFNSAGKNIPFKKFYLYSRVLAEFYKFHWTSKICATLTMRNRFLGVQISLIWVVFAVKTDTLLWQPVKSWDTLQYSNLLLKLA